MEPQIYMSSGVRQLFLARHDFYMEQVKARVLRNFDNMEKDADRVADEIYDRLGSEYSEDGVPLGCLLLPGIVSPGVV